MNKEDFVSLQCAKLLQEKGFDEPCKASFLKNGMFKKHDFLQTLHDMIFDSGAYYEFLAPSLYQAQKWLRNKQSLHIEISYMMNDEWEYEILTIPRHDLVGLAYREPISYPTYESALNAGIIEALKLINP